MASLFFTRISLFISSYGFLFTGCLHSSFSSSFSDSSSFIGSSMSSSSISFFPLRIIVGLFIIDLFYDMGTLYFTIFGKFLVIFNIYFLFETFFTGTVFFLIDLFAVCFYFETFDYFTFIVWFFFNTAFTC